MIYNFAFCNDKTYGYIFSIQVIDVIASIIDISWLFTGMEDFKKIVIRNTLVKIVGLIIIFIFVKSPNDLIIYVLSYSSTLFLGNLSMWVYCPKYIKKVKISSLKIKRHIIPAISLFLLQIASSVYTMLDKTMIGALTHIFEEVAYYEQSQKIIKATMALSISLGSVMLPRIANLQKKGKINEVKENIYSSFQIISLMTWPLCFGIIGTTKGLVPWFFGAGFDKVIFNMYLISPIIIIIGYSSIIGVQFLLPTGRQKEFSISLFVGTFSNLLSNFILIPYLLSYGAAIGTVIAELCVTSLQFYFIRNYFELRKVFYLIYKYIIASVFMMLILFLVSGVLPTGIIYTMIEIIIGIVVYFEILIILKDKSLIMLLNKIIKKKG